MKSVIVSAFLLAFVPVAFAADKEPPKPATTCGKTSEECQKVVDSLNTQIKQLQWAYQAVRQQRAQEQQARSDEEVTDYLKQQQAAEAATKK
jgi:hypothetical protein